MTSRPLAPVLFVIVAPARAEKPTSARGFERSQLDLIRRRCKKPPMASLEREILPVREAYDRWAPHYDHDANPLVALDELVVPRLVGAVRGLRIADLGCGTGRHTLRLASGGAHVTAVDFSPNMLEQASRRLAGHAVTFVEHDLTKRLPFEDASFDGVLSCLALEHIADLAAFFVEARRICHP
jgi:ubiquinone/menaquinone biosynthesis C-methylase UbiE